MKKLFRQADAYRLRSVHPISSETAKMQRRFLPLHEFRFVWRSPHHTGRLGLLQPAASMKAIGGRYLQPNRPNQTAEPSPRKWGLSAIQAFAMLFGD